MTESPSNAAILFHPSGYDMAGPKLVGRIAAGHGFLRAAIAGRGDQPVTGYGALPRLQGEFKRLVGAIDPAAPTAWIEPDGLQRLAATGACHRADPVLGPQARMRLRMGQAAYSLTGVTHTLATSVALEVIGGLLHEPLADWDAVICTSSVALEAVSQVQAQEAEYLRWRFGPDVPVSGPQLPLIPLGVHTADFEFSAQDRAEARHAIQAGDDEVVALYAGRLLGHNKAHPYPMFAGLQAAAERTGKRVTLVLFGQAPIAEIEAGFRAGAARFAPGVRTIFLNGREVDPRRAWGCADLFISLADGIQETFGLTPVEAMAAGLPCVVTDWNGYKDTVRDRVDGFRIRTWAPGPGAGLAVARAFEGGALDYDAYCWTTGASTIVDIAELTDRLAALIDSPDLRRQMGASGRARARADFDWAVVYRQYQALWAELARRRAAALADPARLARIKAAPDASSAFPDPFQAFGHYPTAHIVPQTRVRLAPAASRALLDEHLGALFGQLATPRPNLLALWAQLEAGAETIDAAAVGAGLHVAVGLRGVASLAKMGLVDILPD